MEEKTIEVQNIFLHTFGMNANISANNKEKCTVYVRVIPQLCVTK